jgi:hypothetical protein
MWRGRNRREACLLPALSDAGARVAAPSLRFHIPLVEPNVRYLRIRLSDRSSCSRPREVAGQCRQIDQPELLVQVLIREA